ncbi:MAG: UDP-N-acetylglucosamine-1-phosphate transferase [Halobacteriota archaeon]
MSNLIMMTPTLVSLITSVILVHLLIKKFKEREITTLDYYKRDLTKVPTGGGIAILLTVFLTYILLYDANSLLEGFTLKIPYLDWKALIVIGLFGFFGALDDYVDIGRPVKIALPYTFSLPIIPNISQGPLIIPLVGALDLGLIYLLVVTPIYIMVVANLVNMHSGFNGMASGLSTVLLGFLALKAIMAGQQPFMLLTVFGAVLGFLWFNRYPSRVFEGNTGAMALGAAIGVGIIASGFLVAGFVMLIPHTANFLMYVYWRIMHKLHPEDSRWQKVKFGRTREDGTLEVPNNLTLKWVLPYYFRVTEKQTVMAMYALTIAFCVAALFIPY